jgi:hypothetical protein
MITLIIIAVAIWTVIRIVQLMSQLWRPADAAGYPRIGVVAAAQG